MNEKTSKLKFEKFNIKTFLIECLIIMVGTFITAIGFKVFLTPHNIVPGGFMGVAQIIYDLIAQTGFTAIPVSIWYIILNAVLYVFAVKHMGLKFGLRVAVGILSYSLFVDLIDKIDFISSIAVQIETEAMSITGAGVYILYAIYGGLLMGAGLGLVFRGNGSTGGSDMVAVLVNKFFPTVTTGQIVMTVDGIVVVLSAIAYQSLVLPLYALITIFLCGKVADLFVDGVRSFRAFYIVTEKKEELSQTIFEKVHRGVTNIKCEGMYTHKDRDMLMVIVRRSQVMMLKRVVKEVDPNSFMFSANVKEAYGQGFLTYTESKKQKNKKNKAVMPEVKEEKFKNKEEIALTQKQSKTIKNKDKKEV